MDNFEKEHHWEFYLRDNPLTKDNDKDCIAEVKTGPKTLRSEDIAKEIKRIGSEAEYETILSIVSQNNRIIKEYLLDGNSVMTDLCQFTPRLLGPFNSPTAKYDPNVNRLSFDIVLTKEMRESLRKVKTINLGMKRETMRISLVTDVISGKTDGTITPDNYIRIEGDRLRIVGDESTTGIFFVPADGSATVKAVPPYIQNDPKCVIPRVPKLADGQYTLRIVTAYTRGKQLLKEARTIEYETPLTVGSGDDDDRPVIE